MAIKIKIEIINEDQQGSFAVADFVGDELTSAISEAIIYLQEKQQKELEL